MKKYGIFAILALAIITLAGCGTKVEVPPAHVGKIMGKNGYLEGTIPTSKFRLDRCFAYCDRIVLLSIKDFPYKEGMTLLMPKDKLEMTFDIRMTLAVAPDKYEPLFNKLSPTAVDDIVSTISINDAYQTYAGQIIRTEAREYLSQYSIAEVISNLETINAELTRRLSKTIAEKTPFVVRHMGIGDVKYPDIITKAQENAAERRESIQKEEAQLEISKVTLSRELQEAELRRKVEVEKARADAEVNRIMAASITPQYLEYRKLEILEKLAASQNKAFIPATMLDSLAGQVALGNTVSK